MEQQDKKAAVFFRILAGLCLAFIIYASLTYAEPEGEVMIYAKWFGMFWAPFARNFRSLNILKDMAVNIVFYLPLGMLIPFAFGGLKSRYISPWIVLGLGLSVCMEFLQIFFGRQADILDIILNTSGYLFGYWTVVFAMRRYSLRPAALLGFVEDEKDSSSTNTLIALRFMYMCAYALAALVPFDISVSSARVYGQFLATAGAAPRIILDPLYHFYSGGMFSPVLMLEFLSYMPIAVLTALVDLRRKRLSWVNAVWCCFVFAACVEGAQVFVQSQTTDAFSLVLAVLAASVVWAGVRFTRLKAAEGQSEVVFDARRKKLISLLLIFYVFGICLMAWAPYQFEPSHRSVADKLSYGSNIIPFRLHLIEPSVSKITDLAKEAGLFVPVGILIAVLMSGAGRWFASWKTVLTAMLFSLVFASFVELTQAACVGRYVDITDVLMAALGGVVGVFIAPVFRISVKRNDN